jgi:small subunit ribosomal protein S6
MLRVYEALIVFDVQAGEAAVDAWCQRISSVIRPSGGEITKVEKWGKRAFAYEVAHKSEGFYAVVRFTASPESLAELDRQLKLAEEVIRHKIMRLPRAALVGGGARS